jgi:hypothetical protein
MKKVISNTTRKNEKKKEIITKRYFNIVYRILFLRGIRIRFSDRNLILHNHHKYVQKQNHLVL